MKVCIIGDGLISLTLAKGLVNLGIYVDIFTNKKLKEINKYRTIGISKANIEFFNNKILKIEKLLWKIKRIEIYSQRFENEKILDFDGKGEQLFSILKNYELNQCLKSALNKSKFIKFKKLKNNSLLHLKKKYNLIVNSDNKNFFTKKYFFKKLDKDYNSYAHTTFINHKNFKKNNTATQIFTEIGPIAFLPISDFQTSIVGSFKGNKNIDFKNLIKKYNFKYSITKINKISCFELKSSNLRSYYYQNILAFGELLHKLHPLAGQGFNMSIRDIKELLDLIKFKIDNGLELDSSICKDFEKKTKHKNYLFSNGVDFIYEFFNLETKIKNPHLSKSVSIIGKNKFMNKFFKEIANNGIAL